MNKPFDPTKPVQTRDGRPARIICRDVTNNDYQIVALITNKIGKEVLAVFTICGHYYVDLRESPTDLVNVPVKRDGWVNLYDSCGELTVAPVIYESEQEAIDYGIQSRAYRKIARIVWED